MDHSGTEYYKLLVCNVICRIGLKENILLFERAQKMKILIFLDHS